MNAKLQEAITTPMKTILAVRACFDYCCTPEDVQAVIKKIPVKFGKFEVLMISEDKTYFLIQNVFEKDGVMKSQIVAHDFYNIKEDLYYDYARKN